MKYLTFIELQIRHAYYRDDLCPDFAISADPATTRTLRNHRAVLRTMPDRVQILLPVDSADAPLIPLDDATHFIFHLSLNNPHFALFTDLTALAQQPAPLYHNSTDDATLALGSKQRQSTEQFTVERRQPAADYVLSGDPLPDAAFAIDGLGAVNAPTGYNPTAKRLTVDTSAATVGDRFAVSYPARPHQPRGTLAEVDIAYRATWPPIAAGARVFTVRFVPTDIHWTYYVVVDNGDSTVAIVDAAETDALSFSTANRTDLTGQPDAADPVGTALAERYGDKRTLRFVSDTAIPCQQRPRATLQLRMADDPVIPQLPNPTVHSTTTVPLAGGADVLPVPAHYTIVKYFAQ
jgi:hypothetical protein